MTINAKLYVGLMTGAGGLALTTALAQWNTSLDLSFLCALILGTLVSASKIQLPGLTGTISGALPSSCSRPASTTGPQQWRWRLSPR